jgi:hypothetical protein
MPIKLLFITSGKSPDYLNDCLYHGLRSLEDVEVYSNSPMWFMYDDIDDMTKSSLYGKGFTVFGRIPAANKRNVFSGLNSLEIYRKIVDRFFDIVVYGSIWRCSSYLNLVSRYYSPNKIFLIDGEDHQRINNNRAKGVYFKRENVSSDAEPIHPIGFAVPEELVIQGVPPKEKYWATVIPGNLATYIFDSETNYFADYQRSKFAITTKKAGWDCLRHYEILMNGCVPYFPFIEDCPKKTMANLPKAEFAKCYKLINDGLMSDELYRQTGEFLLQYTREKLTTRALARYVLGYL